MIAFDIPQYLLDKAKYIVDKQAIQYGHRIHNYGNYGPTLAELVMSKYLGLPITSNYDYDMILPDGRTLDVKSKLSNYTPQDYFDVTVSNTKRQQCDLYAFAFCKLDNTRVHLVGYLPTTDFYEAATPRKKGETYHKITFKQDCHMLTIGELEPIEDLLKIVVDSKTVQA